MIAVGWIDAFIAPILKIGGAQCENVLARPGPRGQSSTGAAWEARVLRADCIRSERRSSCASLSRS
jgi:hypothetical protein